tara:strand:+ start:281 stop:469 length:189 start_codon:yes stop_codon:yes gene_type:complete
MYYSFVFSGFSSSSILSEARGEISLFVNSGGWKEDFLLDTVLRVFSDSSLSSLATLGNGVSL